MGIVYATTRARGLEGPGYAPLGQNHSFFEIRDAELVMPLHPVLPDHPKDTGDRRVLQPSMVADKDNIATHDRPRGDFD